MIIVSSASERDVILDSFCSDVAGAGADADAGGIPDGRGTPGITPFYCDRNFIKSESLLS